MVEKVVLPYSYDALEPYIDKETVRIHYTKHLQTYVDNYNKLIEKYNYLDKIPLGKVLANIENIDENIREEVKNQGGGVWNHNFYFSILTPNSKKKPEGHLMEAIKKTFGTFENLVGDLSNVAVKVFGSGYGWLVMNKKGELMITKTANQDSPLSDNKIPLLNIDVWEHAYYLKYKNLRADYVKNIWNIINWDLIEKLYNQCMY